MSVALAVLATLAAAPLPTSGGTVTLGVGPAPAIPGLGDVAGRVLRQLALDDLAGLGVRVEHARHGAVTLALPSPPPRAHAQAEVDAHSLSMAIQRWCVAGTGTRTLCLPFVMPPLVVDAQTVELALAPDADADGARAVLASPLARLVWPDALEPAGSGAFRLATSLRAPAPRWTLRAFEAHARGRPLLDAVVVDTQVGRRRDDGASPLGERVWWLRVAPERRAAVDALPRRRLAERLGAHARATLLDLGAAPYEDGPPIEALRDPPLAVTLLVPNDLRADARALERLQLELLRLGLAATLTPIERAALPIAPSSTQLVLERAFVARGASATEQLVELLSVVDRLGVDPARLSTPAALTRADAAAPLARAQQLARLDAAARAATGVVVLAAEPALVSFPRALVGARIDPSGRLALDDAHLGHTPALAPGGP